ncbi:MAG: cation-translocating P-type ATPase [Lachnospiraceae bacterium]
MGKTYWECSKEEVLSQFSVTEQGLSGKQVEEIRGEKGENILQEEKKKSIWQIFMGQFADLLVVILVIAAVISMFSGNAESTLVILLVLVMNAVLGTVQYEKAQKSLNSLKQLSSPHAKAVRDGQMVEIASKDVVPGDILLLEAGDMVVADGRILHNYSLQVNESSLTGEATNVDKTDNTVAGDAVLADRLNMVYSGSLVTYGRAMVLVTATGMETEIGHIAELMNAAKQRKTPLQQSLDRFSQHLAIAIMVICVLVFGLCMVRQMPLLDALLFAVALAVAAIPEALGSIVTIVQAFGTQKMAKEHAIIKDLKAVESLGCVSVICSDKTGTLTQNKMTVQQIYANNRVYKPEQLDMKDTTLRCLLYDAVLTNDASIADGQTIGDPTEYALLEMFRKVKKEQEGLEQAAADTEPEETLRRRMRRLEELPFDSDRKLMSTKYLVEGEETVLTKGAPDILLEHCTRILEKNEIRQMTAADKKTILRQNQSFSEQGLRVLAFAYKVDIKPLSTETEKDFVFLGLVSMVDPPRPESVQAVADAKNAGIRTVMITGDHKVTATAIARKIGIFEDGDLALTGAELDAMSDKELEKAIDRVSVYARVSPENKIRIVEAWQRNGRIVSMTGDGVNDAPALKKADIGVAMGVTGTEVSKDAADMILADDNFATIIKAVVNGRNVYRNIKNAVLFLLSGNMAAILAVLYTSLVGLSVPFAPVHLLFINLLTDSLPALAIGMEAADPKLLQERPRNPKEGILTREFMLTILGEGFLIAVVTLSAYYIGLRTAGTALASTMAFATLTLARLFHGFNCRSKEPLVRIGLLSNRYSLYAFFAGVILLLLVLIVPGLQGLFEVAPLSVLVFVKIAILSVLPTVTIQLVRICRLRRE